MKSLFGIEVGEEALAWQAIDEVARGEGHCLGRTETLERLQSDLVYPEMAIVAALTNGKRTVRGIFAV